MTSKLTIEEHARKAANESGYLFQMKVEHEIKRTSRVHNPSAGGGGETAHDWKVLSSEHAWGSAIEGIAGFADILLLWERGGVSILLVVECKRRTTPTWTFPIPNDTGVATAETRCLYTRNVMPDIQPQAVQLLLALT